MIFPFVFDTINEGGTLKRLLLLSSLFLFVIFFQNCSGSNNHLQFFQTDGASKLEAESGNGTGYGGKLTQNFYHYVPGYQCEGRAAPFAKLEYSPTDASSILITNKENQCLSISNSISNTEIDTGALQKNAIGLNEKIFEFNAADKIVIPENPIEIWCVDQWESPTFEILSRYNSSKKKSETEFYFPNLTKRTESNPARVVNQQSVKLSSNYFDLLVNKENPGLKPGTFTGQLRRFDEAADTLTRLQCRLGGYLDARLWPAKVVNFDNLQQMEWNANEGQFYLITGNSNAPWSENILATYSANGSRNRILINNSANSQGIKHFEFSKDRSNILLQAHLVGDNTIQLYSLDPKSNFPPLRLNSKLTDWGQAVSNEIATSSTGEFVYYMDGAQETGSDVEQWLRAVSIKTGQIYQINQNLLGADVGVGQYDVSHSMGKVIYSTGFVFHDVWIADLLGGNQRPVDLSAFLGSDYILEWYMKKSLHWQLIGDRYLALVAMPRDGYHNPTSKLLVIDLKSETVVLKKDLPELSFYLSPIYDLPLLSVVSYSGATLYLDLSSMTFIAKDQMISNYEASTNPMARILASDLKIMQTHDLCNADEQVISRMPMGGDRWLILKKGEESLTHIYITAYEANTCKRINQITLSEEQLKALIAVDQKSLNSLTGHARSFVKAQISADEKSVVALINNKLLFIPTDDQPIVEIYTAMNSTPTFEEFGFINNEKIYFKGQVISNSLSNLFLWNIPKF